MTGGEVVPAQRILVADDEPAITNVIAQVLRYSGFEVVEVQGGVKAIAEARESKPGLILLDVMMPDLDGPDVCRLLKMDATLRDVPVILFSSADGRDVNWRGAGADGFLQKPFSIKELPALVRRFLTSAER